MVWHGLYPGAVLILSVGVGSRLASFGAARAYPLYRLVHRTVWPLCFTVAALAAMPSVVCAFSLFWPMLTAAKGHVVNIGSLAAKSASRWRRVS